MAGGKIASKLLDMASGARKARALEQGYDPSKIWYHGTPGDELEEFASDRVGSLHPDSFGYHFTNQKHEAGMYAGKGGTIGRYVTRAENPLVYDLDLYSPYSSAADKADSGRSHILQKIRDEADKGNIHDAVLIRRPLHEGAVNENLIMLDPEKIRSTKAAFDPDKRSSSKLLDSILMPAAGTGIAASALLAPEEAEASFVGEGAQGIYKGIIAAARKMADSGIPREQIWRDTWDMGGGAYKGPDGKWRVEVDDSTLQMNPLLPDRAPESTRDTIPMGFDEAVRAPALVDAYPDLPSMRVSAKGNVSGGAYYAPSGDPFGNERVDLPMRSRGGRYANEDSSRSATAHELAHAIQQREGFSGGTNPGLARREYPKANGKDYTDEEAIELYMNNAGEAEARNVQARLSLTPDQRKAKFPWDTLDRPENDLWLSSHNGRNDSIRASDLPPLPTATQTIRHGFGRGADLGAITPMANPRMMGVANALDRASDATVPVLRPFIPFMESGADWARKAAQGHTSWWDKLLVGMDAI